MSKHLDLLRTRIAGDARAEVRVKIYLDPSAGSHLAALQNELAQLRQDAAASNRPEKLNGRMSTLARQVEEAEQNLLTSIAYVVLRALSSDQAAAAASGLTPDDPMSKLWRANLAAAFVRVEDADHVQIDDITRGDWVGLLDVLSNTEIANIHSRLAAADADSIPS